MGLYDNSVVCLCLVIGLDSQLKTTELDTRLAIGKGHLRAVEFGTEYF